MIKIESKKNKFTYNVYHVTKAFYPKEDIVQTVDEKQEPLVKIHLPEGTCFSLAPEECVQTEDVQEEKRDVTKKVYQFLSKQTGQKLAWGMLTGVRPTKLVMQKIEQGMTKEENFEFLKEQYCVTDKKAQIAYEIACREKALLDRLDCQNGYSLYAGIPFCPSICSYCSFSSSPIAEWKDQVDRYLDAMIKELKATAKLMQENHSIRYTSVEEHRQHSRQISLTVCLEQSGRILTWSMCLSLQLKPEDRIVSHEKSLK